MCRAPYFSIFPLSISLHALIFSSRINSLYVKVIGNIKSEVSCEYGGSHNRGTARCHSCTPVKSPRVLFIINALSYHGLRKA